MRRTTAGVMRHLCDLQKDVGTTIDSRGHRTADWQTQTRAYCAIEPLTGNELVVQRQVHPLVTHKITTRWQSSVSPLPTWRITKDGRTFHIDSILNVDERNEFWEVIATEEVSVTT